MDVNSLFNKVLHKTRYLYFVALIFNSSAYSNNITPESPDNLQNLYENALAQSFEIWKIIDLVRAIKYTSESRTHFSSKLIDNFIVLYADLFKLFKIKSGNKAGNKDSKNTVNYINNNININNINYLYNILNTIKAHFFDVFYDVNSKEFFCICLIFEKLDILFQDNLELKS